MLSFRGPLVLYGAVVYRLHSRHHQNTLDWERYPKDLAWMREKLRLNLCRFNMDLLPFEGGESESVFFNFWCNKAVFWAFRTTFPLCYRQSDSVRWEV